MKKILLLAISATYISAYALPTYEPFTEFYNTIAVGGSNMVAIGANGVALGTNASGQVNNCVDLATGGYTAPSGEKWTSLNFSGTAGTNIHGLDIAVTSNSTVFTSSALSSLLPSTFPGFPDAGDAITNIVENPAQPTIWNGSNAYAPSANIVGNSAVLSFAQDITRPSSGTKTVYVSYLFSVVQLGQLGQGNDGRYFAFLASSNLVEGTGSGGNFTTWAAMFNNFNTTSISNRYAAHGLIESNGGASTFVGACDSSTGKDMPTNGANSSPFILAFGNHVAFVVGSYTFNSGGLKDTNTVWVNPALGSFGGPTPPTTPIDQQTMAFNMSDVGGIVIEDRVGSGGAGGVGTNYMANLLVGSTWSYVTGGPEFTNPIANVVGSVDSTVSLSAAATAAGQTVSYQWQHVFGGVTNNLTNGIANPGGSAMVSGATSTNLTLTGISNGDTNGFYVVVATASGTGFTLTATATVAFDPLITAQPQEVFTTPGGTANFSVTATTQFPSLTYLWQLNGVNLSDTTLADGSVISGSGTSTLTIANAQKDENNATITVGVTNGLGQGEISAPATLITTDPAITSEPQPVQQTVNYGGQAQFTATALTSPSHAPLTYAWYDGATILSNGPQPDGSTATGATGTSGASSSLSAILTLNNVSYLDNGSYSLLVTNSEGLVATSAVATLFVNDPVISVQPPATVEVALGGSGAIPIVAAGSGVTYQWFNVNGPLSGDFSGANSATLMISGAQTNDSGTYYVTVMGVTNTLQSANVNLVVDTAVTAVTLSPAALTQQAGTHLALVGTVTGGTGGLVHLLWQLNGATLTNGAQADGSTISGIGTTTLVLSNLHTADSGTYTLIASNAASDLSASSVVRVSSGLLPLSTTNLVVTRIGEGSQALSGATGNTLYLDQLTTNGGYVSTIMVPDNGGSTLIVPGAGADGLNESYLTLSSNKSYLNFAGYFENYPFLQGSDLTVGGTTFVRGIGSVNGLGYYTLAYTNEGLYSGGNHFIRCAYSTDGLINFWCTGAAGSGAIKYVNAGPAGASYATGSGIPALSTSVTSPQVLGQVGPNLVFSDNGDSGLQGLNEFTGGLAPEANIATVSLLAEGSPADFAFSPDSNTVYVADSSAAISGGTGYGGGIQRWDLIGGVYSYEYNLEDTTGLGTNGARGMTVVYPPSITTWGQNVSGAIIYATTSEAVSNRLIEFTDTGLNSTPTLLATAGPNQFLQGVRFGPLTLPVEIATAVQSSNIFTGLSDTLTVSVTGDAPLFYQWQFDGANISGATTSSLALSSLAESNSGTYSVTVSNLISTNSSSAVITVTNAGPILLVGPQSRVETAGDHLAFSVSATGTLPIKYQWQFDGANIAGATASAIGLTNIVLTNSGTYSVTYTNQFGTNNSSATLLVTTSLQSLSSNNLVVARLGDGVQALSSATGNTVYLDQITTAGVYSNTIMIPDNAAAGSFIVAGGTAEAPQGTVLTLSANNSNFLNFPGFASTYPATNLLTGETVPRAIGAVNAFGYYDEPLTPLTLYDGAADDFFDGVVSLDGYAEFWSAGTAGSPPSIKYITPATAGTAGGIGALAGSATGTRVVQIVAGNVVYSDTLSSPAGIWGFAGEPVTTAGAADLVADAAGNPNDFAASPDTTSFPPATSTVYLCDSSPIANGGGIQRYDWNSGANAYTLSYTLGTGAGSTVGASCLAVDFSASAFWGPGANGAVIYATTTGTPGNSLIKIIDNGSSSSATVLETASPNEILRGVRFGPVQGPAIIISNPLSTNAFVGEKAVFKVVAQNGPLSYQWQLNGTNLANGPSLSGSGATVGGALTSTLTITNVGPMDDQGSYTVVVSNPFLNSAVTSSPPAVLSVPVNITSFPVAFESVTNGGTATFTVAATGGAPLSFQWNGPCGGLTDGLGGDLCNSSAVVAGSTTASLTISNVGSADSGSYYVTVSNQDPSSTNTVAEESVLDVYTGPPIIISDIQPSSLVAPVGFKAVFSVTAAGSTPLVYQWQLNGTNLADNGHVSGSQTSVLTIPNSQLSDSGSYQLFITNSAGTNYSSTASLTVTLIGFNNGGGWTANGDASISSGSLSLTQGGTSETSSSFLEEPLDVAAFLASWTYQESPGAGAADGTAFVLQNAPAGAAALGGGGGELGYVGISDSIAFEFNIYSANTIGIAIGTNGLGSNATTTASGGPYKPTGSVNIASGDPIGVTLEYIGGVASLTLTDSVASVSFTTNYHVNVTNFVGSNTAYVGFTGAAGGVASSQTVSDFFFTSLPSVAAAKVVGGALVLTWPVSAPGLVLQESSSLSSPDWVNVTTVPTVVNGQNQVTITPSGTGEFYRLTLQ